MSSQHFSTLPSGHFLLFLHLTKFKYFPFNSINEGGGMFVSGKQGILRLYPDLAGRLAKFGGLTSESTREHAAAGLDSLTAEEQSAMSEMNERYHTKFGFPFIICARENKKDAILKGLKSRLESDQQTEMETGLAEVKKICRLRLLDLVTETDPKL